MFHIPNIQNSQYSPLMENYEYDEDEHGNKNKIAGVANAKDEVTGVENNNKSTGVNS